MKILKFAFALLLCATISSCSSDDDNNTEDLSGQTGDLILKFDNGVGDQDFIFGTTYTRTNGESYQLTTLKYLISNVSLKDDMGNVYTYPAENNIFIVSEANGNTAGEIYITLEDVDAANYTEVTFGVGIDQDRYASGADGQGDFLTTAQDEGMMWSWATGYRFTRLDGTFTSATETDAALNIHMGSVGTAVDNYKETTITLPNEVLVREDKTPEIHIKADISQVFDGVTTVSFDDGYAQVHTDPIATGVIATNLNGAFSVHHVHND
ncbi:MbnP family protein [Algibacter sp. L1A34]|uniref:MbnP family protein n=1 Tax=Algibacter sp. L1A34 TaxID=2686365 RepID=UPI00131DF771|nr:MbnP family protein [Algibacter sp. L1A34]